MKGETEPWRDEEPRARTKAELRKELKLIRRASPQNLAAAVEFLYEDENLIAVDKPAGLPVISPEGGRGRSLYDIVTDRIRKKNPKGRAAVVHRIDRDTSGLVIFATNAATKKLLMEGWDEIVRERRYLALVEGEMEAPEGRRESWLIENRAGAVYETKPKSRGAKRAATRWKVVDSGMGLSLLEVSLETGRKHQIRVQLAAMGHPVAGDERYGSRIDPLRRLGLHAELIELALPGSRPPVRFECPAPATFRQALGGRRPTVRGRAQAKGKPVPAAIRVETAKGPRAAPKSERVGSKANPAANGTGFDVRKGTRPLLKGGIEKKPTSTG
jgi:23S rRNA pseudouridine1911/1915/1917 synthase